MPGSVASTSGSMSFTASPISISGRVRRRTRARRRGHRARGAMRSPRPRRRCRPTAHRRVGSQGYGLGEDLFPDARLQCGGRYDVDVDADELAQLALEAGEVHEADSFIEFHEKIDV